MRQKWIDILRGIGIFCVLLAHSSLGILDFHIASFFIPIFFFISGYLFKENKYSNFWEILKKKSKTILLPYFLISLTLLIIYVLFNKVDIDFFFTQLFGILYSRFEFIHGDSNSLNAIFNPQLWFLTALFVCEILYYLITKTKRLVFIFVIMFAVIGILLNTFLPFYLPWSIDIALICLPFFYLGKFLQSCVIEDKFKLIFLTVFLVFNLILAYLNGVPNVSVGVLGNPILFYIAAICGILFYFIASPYLEKLPIISSFFIYIGLNSLTILGFHIFAYYIIRIVLNRVLPSFEQLNGQLIHGLVYSLLAVLILWYPLRLINKYLPSFTGKS
ncbi:MAG: acyltransferase family protein [Candidatus Dojkabacteria bacterium]